MDNTESALTALCSYGTVISLGVDAIYLLPEDIHTAQVFDC